MLSFQCPHCHGEITIADEFAGRRGNCVHCGAAITAPSPPPTPPVLRYTNDTPPRLHVQFQDPPPAPRPRGDLHRAVTWGFGIGCGLLLLGVVVFILVPLAIVSLSSYAHDELERDAAESTVQPGAVWNATDSP